MGYRPHIFHDFLLFNLFFLYYLFLNGEIINFSELNFFHRQTLWLKASRYSFRKISKKMNVSNNCQNRCTSCGCVKRQYLLNLANTMIRHQIAELDALLEFLGLGEYIDQIYEKPSSVHAVSENPFIILNNPWTFCVDDYPHQENN